MSEINEISVLEERRKYGVFITRIAWAVEVLACITGFLIALNFSGVFKNSFSSDAGIVAIAFGIVAIVELTKIPLVTAIYFGIVARFRVLFSILLFLVCLGTFETLIQGFEVSQKGRTAEIDELFQKINSLDEEKVAIETQLKKDNDFSNEIKSEEESEREKINTIYKNKIDEVVNQRNDYLKGPEDLLQDNRNEIKSLLAGGNTSGKIKIIKVEINGLKEQITDQNKCIERENRNINELKKGFGSFTKQNDIKAAENRRQKCTDDKNKYTSDLNKAQKDLRAAGSQSDDNINQQIKLIEKENDALENKITVIREDSRIQIETLELERDKRLGDLNENIDTMTAEQINVSEDKPQQIKRIKEIEEEVAQLESSFEILAYENQMYRISKKVFFKEKFVDVSQGMVSTVFFLWFGTIAMVVALVGPGLALAGLTLRDRRVKEEDIATIKRPKKFINGLRKLFIARRKFYNSPKIKKIYEIKEVEVTKEVPVVKEVIVEKEVIKRVPVKETKIKYMPVFVDEPPEKEK